MPKLRITIRRLMIATAIVAAVCHVTIRFESPKNPHLDIARILNSNLSVTAKLEQLCPLVAVGDKSDAIDTRFGECRDVNGHGPGFFQYHFHESGLVIAFCPDGIAYGIGYFPNTANGKLVWLSMPDSVTSVEHESDWIELNLTPKNAAGLQCDAHESALAPIRTDFRGWLRQMYPLQSYLRAVRLRLGDR